MESLKLLVVIALLCLTGCGATPQYDQLSLESVNREMRFQELTEVPFFPQEDYQCGPAALATVLMQSGVDVTPDQLTSLVYLPEREGSLQIEMVAATRQFQRIGYADSFALKDIIDLIDQQQPVLVLQNLGLTILPQWHYAVVIGYDFDSAELILRSGTEKRYLVPMNVFERTWVRAGSWAMLALKPGQLPETALKPAGYFQALTDLEMTNRDVDTLPAWRVGVQQWPLSIPLQMGLSNRLYATGERQQAGEVLTELLKDHPDYAPAMNNLAQILLEEGALEPAKTLVERALVLVPPGQPDHEIYRSTRRDILKALSKESAKVSQLTRPGLQTKTLNLSPLPEPGSQRLNF